MLVIQISIHENQETKAIFAPKLEYTMNYSCKKCSWQGPEEKLDYDDVDTCGGNDKIEMCPECGSYEVVVSK